MIGLEQYVRATARAALDHTRIAEVLAVAEFVVVANGLDVGIVYADRDRLFADLCDAHEREAAPAGPAPRYGPAWLRERLDGRAMTISTCPRCGIDRYWSFAGGEVWRLFGCACNYTPIEVSSYDEVASWLADKPSDRQRDEALLRAVPPIREDDLR